MKKTSYKKSGVDIDKADKLIKNAKKLIDTTRVKGSVDSVGGFGGIFAPGTSTKKGEHYLVASTDGVGTKLKVAQITGRHSSIGIDLVAMCVNDILCCGAKPMFFLDYFACGKLQDKTWKDVIKGIVKACREAECALLGGETAEMPGMYPKGEYDLAGFSVGIVKKEEITNPKRIKNGDILLGLASTGLHSNGYSLVRKLFSKKELKEKAGTFLKPTAIYVKAFEEIKKIAKIKGAAHITGGGFYDNVPRMLPKEKKAVIEKRSWKEPKVFSLIREKGVISEKEMYRTFNMGIGMVIAISPGKEKKIIDTLRKKFHLNSWVIGEIVKGSKSVTLV